MKPVAKFDCTICNVSETVFNLLEGDAFIRQHAKCANLSVHEVERKGVFGLCLSCIPNVKCNSINFEVER